MIASPAPIRCSSAYKAQVISVPPMKRDLKDMHNNRYVRMSKKPHIDLPKAKIAEFCKKWKIREFSLFGSVLREDFRPDSDIDVLVTFSEDAKHTLFDLVHMENELKQILGRDVDIVSRRGIESSRNYIRRNAIIHSAEAVYAA